MLDILKYFKKGMKNTLLLKNNSGFSYNGPWIQVYEDTLLDRWHMGDFASVEYTISADLDNYNREIVKCLVTATVDTASIVVYARNNTQRPLIEVSATVNSSYVDIILNAAQNEDSAQNLGAKVIFTAKYYHSQHALSI